MKRSFAVGLGLMLAAACNRNQEHESRAATTSSAPSNVGSQAPSPWQQGAERTYELSLKSKLDLGRAGSVLELDLTSKLNLFVRRGDPQSTEIGVVLHRVRLSGSGDQVDIEKLAQEIEKPYLFTLKEGKLDVARLPAQQSTFAASILRTVAAAFQFARGAGPGWMTEESDATGPYVAEYKALAEPGRFSKKKLRYGAIEELKASHGLGMGLQPLNIELSPQVVSSTGEVRISGEQLSSVSYREQLELRMLQASPVKSSTELSLALAKLERFDPAPDWNAIGSALTSVAAGRPYVNASERVDLDPVRIGDLTFEKAVSELEKLNDKKPTTPAPRARLDQDALARDSEQEARLFVALEALLRRDPKNVELAARRIRRGSPAERGLLNALASSGAAGAQATLVELAADAKTKPELRKAAVLSLFQVRRPLESTETTLTQLLDDDVVRVNAVYALGAMARRLREAGETDRAKRIATVLVGRLATTERERDTVAVLHGLANAGENDTVDAVLPYVDSTNESLRMAAVQVLGALTSARSEAMLIERLGKEPKTSVRNAVLSACATRTPTEALAKAVERVALEAPDPHGRIEAVRVLARWTPMRADLRAAIERVAKTDAEPKVREAAQRALGS